MTRTLTMSVALLVAAALPQFAQLTDNRNPRMQCNDHNGDSGRARFCEIRETTLPASGATLNVDALQNGGVTVYGWTRPDVLVRAKVESQADTDAIARSLASQVSVQTGGLMVRAVGPQTVDNQSWSVSYEVFAPQSSSVYLRAHNGGMHVSDIIGSIDCQTVNGGLSMTRVGGTVKGETTNGGLKVEFAGARFEGSGADLKTTNGGVSITLPQSFNARVEAETVNGGLNGDIPITPEERRNRRSSFTLGSGGPLIHVATTNGGISVKRT